ncbi:hypothetical protein AB3G45_02470 [Shinella sp. S4-D37]|uniref:hypothetical protein n=1 Tax=Shinella sp. S4-D37 TaxID=3161999 RepID=UPI003465670B
MDRGNRTGLRNLLRDICDHGFDYGLIYVAGATASGRTHSKHLIRHVAARHNIRYYIVDFHIETEARTLGHLYEHLKAAYRLATLDVPIHQGATPGDVAFRFAARLRAQLQIAIEKTPKPWVVIDFTDEVIDPAVAEFIGRHRKLNARQATARAPARLSDYIRAISAHTLMAAARSSRWWLAEMSWREMLNRLAIGS